MDELVQLQVAGPIATMTFNRPEVRNALSPALVEQAHAQLDAVAARDDVRVLVITGAGKAFCAGMDLKSIVGQAEVGRRLLHGLARLLVRLRELPVMVLGRVNGAAIGGGCGLACACDLALTHTDAKLGFPEVTLGLTPAVVAPWVVRRIGAGRARPLLLRGGVVSGQDAAAIGLVAEVVTDLAELDSATAELAQRLAQGAPQAMRATKALLNQLDGSVDMALAERCAELSATVLASAEAQRALRAVVERGR